MSESIGFYHSHSNDYKSRFLDRRDRTKYPHIGFELEVHCDGDLNECFETADSYLNDTEQRFCYEEDCSIGMGFECISRPADIKYWMDNFSSIENACRTISRMRCTSHNGGRCGFHVHIDRKYFGESGVKRELAEAKLLWLFEKHWDCLAKFSRRRRFKWCGKLSKYGKTIPDIVKNSKYLAEGKNRAVNIEKPNTIEIRLWRGTLRPETIKATLKFSVRLAELVKSKTVCELDKMSFEEILGDDEDILAYWETVKDRQVRRTNNED